MIQSSGYKFLLVCVTNAVYVVQELFPFTSLDKNIIWRSVVFPVELKKIFHKKYLVL